ncbi:hypothetical protein ACWF95_27660 [Streptomyces vinaceus]
MHMPHDPVIHYPAPVGWQPAPTPVPGPLLPAIPARSDIQLVTLPDGTRTLAYTHPAPTEAATALAHRGAVPRWAKTTALLAPTLGGGIGAAGIGISYAAPGLIAMADLLWAAVALIAAGALAPLLLRTGTSRAHRGAPVQHITQNITATGLFGKATGTLNHR